MSVLRKVFPVLIALLFCILLTQGLIAETKGVEHGKRYDRLVIRNVIIVDGNGTPAKGPADVIVEGNRIASVGAPKQEADAYKDEEHIIDGNGMYLLPGLINLHAHIHDERGNVPIPFEYLYKLWLACGITTIRDVGSNYDKTLDERSKSQQGEITAPRIFIYMVVRGKTPEEGRKNVQEAKKRGADGIKLFELDRDILQAILDEAHKQGLRSAIHVGVVETDAWDCAEFGITTIEHWYGIPDAALHGSQNFPADYNYWIENHRFRYAGRLWREADPEKLKKVLQTMVEKGVAWDPTFAIYEANRDLMRAQNQPWFKDYLHPVLEDYFKPNPAHHASYFWKWTTTDEVFWKENYKIWMKAVNKFARMGGLVGTGEDAGYLQQMYGFTYIRELELHQEAGFHPIDVIQQATGNGAKILGKEKELGRVRQGFLADLILIDANPLENLKYLYPTGVYEPEFQEGKLATGAESLYKGGVKWTIKDGIVYHSPTLLYDVKEMVSTARKEMAGE
jgi:imidazolonepropionase-like amidohydrolase